MLADDDDDEKLADDIRLHGPEDSRNARLLTVKWGKEVFQANLNLKTTSIGDLKILLHAWSDVLPVRQKLLGLKFDRKKLPAAAGNAGEPVTPGTAPEDCLLLASTEIDWKKGIILMGVPEDRVPKRLLEEELPEILDDLDWDVDYSSDDRPSSAAVDPLNQAKLKKVIRKCAGINLIHPLRKGKPLLVLDIDYTIFDMKGDKQDMIALKRPGTDEFLTAMYAHFDLCFWSQTSWRWVELKLTEMQLLTSPTFKIAFVLDKTCMFKVDNTIDGKERRHYVKPLEFIWHHFPHLNERNTVHVDDLSRNFAMNPRCGIKIKAYKKAKRNKGRDFELTLLAEYLLACAQRELTGLQGRQNQADSHQLALDERYDINQDSHRDWHEQVVQQFRDSDHPLI